MEKAERILLTVLTPTYNRVHTLPACFDSLSHQTCTEFEWIVVDDGSTDGTEEYFAGLPERPFPVRYIKKENGGKHTALNAAHPFIHRFQFETNYFGALKTIQACLPQFRAQGFGRIITITSVMAILQLPFQGFYSSVKAAMLSLSESLSMELAGTGIQCCSILPGCRSPRSSSATRRRTASSSPPR